jgi:hypothetical protein
MNVTHRVLVWHVHLAVVALACAASAAPEFIVEDAPKRVRGASPLASHLQAAAGTGATFVGVTRDGKAVLRFPEATTMNAAAGALERAAVRARPRDRESIEFITETVVIHAGRVGDELAGLRVARRHNRARLVVLATPEGVDAGTLNELAALDAIHLVEPAYRYQLHGAVCPDDPAFRDGFQWGTWYVGAPAAWERVHCTDTVVAVLDSGIDPEHPDLKDNLWRNPRETAGDSTDNDGNGYVDDVIGYDFYDGDGDPTYTHAHGTHVAGVIGAVGNNARGVCGIAWRVPLMSLRVFRDTKESAPVDRIVEAIDYAAAHGARVINMSWGGPIESECLRSAIERASGVLFVASVGNGFDGVGADLQEHPQYPASFALDNIVAVAASNEEGVAPFSNRGGPALLAAPGVRVWTTEAGGDICGTFGTSVASGFVSGAASLVWGYLEPAGPAELKRILVEHVKWPMAGVSAGALDISFLCHEEHAREVRLEGTLRHPVVALGGETTGTILRTATGDYELEVEPGANEVRRAIERLVGRRIVVRGKLTVRRGIERGALRIVRVRALEEADG